MRLERSAMLSGMEWLQYPRAFDIIGAFRRPAAGLSLVNHSCGAFSLLGLLVVLGGSWDLGTSVATGNLAQNRLVVPELALW